ncbi:type II toxin-antitoxin system HicA family toxin [Methanophagales archaeon]|nr:MAG: type II toxin-antitoxin system HicA family toxin [Methanophagales archaeon]
MSFLNKKEVKRGTLLSILKQAGMSREKFFELVKNESKSLNHNPQLERDGRSVMGKGRGERSR